MSLSSKQKQATILEFEKNIERLGYPLSKIASEIHTDVTYLQKILQLQATNLEDPWILKNYLVKELTKQHIQEIPFTALQGDHHSYWFLNSAQIDTGVIDQRRG